jgi:low affinity Fe/Cu permease
MDPLSTGDVVFVVVCVLVAAVVWFGVPRLFHFEDDDDV